MANPITYFTNAYNQTAPYLGGALGSLPVVGPLYNGAGLTLNALNNFDASNFNPLQASSQVYRGGLQGGLTVLNPVLGNTFGVVNDYLTNRGFSKPVQGPSMVNGVNQPTAGNTSGTSGATSEAVGVADASQLRGPVNKTGPVIATPTLVNPYNAYNPVANTYSLLQPTAYDAQLKSMTDLSNNYGSNAELDPYLASKFGVDSSAAKNLNQTAVDQARILGKAAKNYSKNLDVQQAQATNSLRNANEENVTSFLASIPNDVLNSSAGNLAVSKARTAYIPQAEQVAGQYAAARGTAENQVAAQLANLPAATQAQLLNILNQLNANENSRASANLQIQQLNNAERDKVAQNELNRQLKANEISQQDYQNRLNQLQIESQLGTKGTPLDIKISDISNDIAALTELGQTELVDKLKKQLAELLNQKYGG